MTRSPSRAIPHPEGTEQKMPIAMLQMMPGGTEEAYEQLGKQIFGMRSNEFSATDAPEGLIMHSAGPTDEGWFVYDVWQSPEHMQRFVDERLVPALQALGVPETGKPQIFQIHNLVQPNRAAVG
jgi:hypothetical protein